MVTTESNDKRKSFFLTLLIYSLLLLALFFIRFWPPANLEELVGGGGGGGIEMNFGDSDLGSGADYKSEVLDVKNETKAVAAPPVQEDDIIAQDNENESDVVVPKKDPVKQTVVPVKKETKVVPQQPKTSKNANDALANIIKSGNKGGDGDDKVAGNKGKANGNLNSGDYYGDGGSGGGSGGGTGTGTGVGTGPGSGSGSGGGNGSGVGNGSGYSLGNRKVLAKPNPKYLCDEQGKVVVEITVDRNGKTIGAIAGVQGTTNTAKCLLDQAKIAALNTKWESSENAPAKQVGKIVYNFSLN